MFYFIWNYAVFSDKVSIYAPVSFIIFNQVFYMKTYKKKYKNTLWKRQKNKLYYKPCLQNVIYIINKNDLNCYAGFLKFYWLSAI